MESRLAQKNLLYLEILNFDIFFLIFIFPKCLVCLVFYFFCMCNILIKLCYLSEMLVYVWFVLDIGHNDNLFSLIYMIGEVYYIFALLFFLFGYVILCTPDLLYLSLSNTPYVGQTLKEKKKSLSNTTHS